jgi:hypothetical protein
MPGQVIGLLIARLENMQSHDAVSTDLSDQSCPRLARAAILAIRRLRLRLIVDDSADARLLAHNFSLIS